MTWKHLRTVGLALFNEIIKLTGMKLKFSVGDKFGKTVLISALGHSKFNYRGYRMKPHDQELHISGKSEYMYTDIKYVCTYNYGPWIIIVLEM